MHGNCANCLVTRRNAAYDVTQTNLRMEALKPLLFIESDLDQAQLERMAKTMTPFAKPPGCQLLGQGDKSSTMFYITQGQVSFFRKPSNGRLKATAVALQKQFEMEERSNALDAAKTSHVEEEAAAAQCFAPSTRPLSAAERRNAFLEMSALMDIGDCGGGGGGGGGGGDNDGDNDDGDNDGRLPSRTLRPLQTRTKTPLPPSHDSAKLHLAKSCCTPHSWARARRSKALQLPTQAKAALGLLPWRRWARWTCWTDC